MASKKILNILFLLFFIFISNKGFSFPDTTLTKRINSFNSTNKFSNSYSHYFEDGILAIKQDSIKNGIKLIVEGYTLSIELENSNRGFSYQSFEFFELLKIINKGDLNKQDEDIGLRFVKDFYTRDFKPDKSEISSYFKEASYTSFSQRLKVLMICLGDNYNLNFELQKLLRNEPSLLSANILKAEIFYNSQYYYECIKMCIWVSRNTSNYAYINYVRALSYIGIGNINKALIDLDETIRWYPEFSGSYYLKSLILMDRSEYSKAILGLKKVLDINPEFLIANYFLASSYRNIDNVDSGLFFINKFLESDSKNSEAFSLRADLYFNSNNYPLAIDNYSSALAIDPTNKYCLIALGRTYVQTKNYDAAIIVYKKVITLDQTYSSALGNLGWTYYLSGNFDECINYSNKALKYDKNATYAMFNISLATLRKGEFEKARKLYEYYIQKCKSKKININEGALVDLKDLIKKNIFVNEAREIIVNVFKETLD